MRSCRVLIVEDNRIDRGLFSAYLREGGAHRFEIAEEELGADGLRRCAEFCPDCVLLDLNLPDMSGIEFLQQLERNGHSVPVVVATAFGSAQLAVTAMKSGASDYVVKNNLTAADLTHAVENAIEKHRLHVELERHRAALQERNRKLETAIAREKAATFAAEESKERYRLLTEAIPQIVWTAGHPDGALNHISSKWVESTGLPVESALGANWIDAVYPDDRERVSASWRDAVAQQSRFEVECRLGSDGRGYRWHLARAVPQFGNDLVLRWFGTFTDIEERKRAEQALLQRQKLESTGVLAGGLAHDFNNLLVGIIGGISYTLETLPSSHEVRPMLENALTASEHAATLVRQMLAYAGKGKFVIAQVQLSELAQSTCELLQSFIPKSVHLKLELGSVVPAIEGDASQIQQIIMNLVINAAEAIGEGNPGVVRVRVGEERLDRANPEEQLEPGIYAALEVADTGCGMSEEVQARIFDPFFTTKFTGRGLGLAAVIGIVRSAKGTVRVHSAPGRGATFQVLLPARAAAGISPPEPAPPAAEGTGRNILLIDDEEIVRNTLQRILERSGHRVHLAAGGYEAVSLVHANPALFDLVLLDMNMPELSGEETLRRLRALRPALNVAVFSGYSEAEILERLAGQKVTGILYKPFNARALASKVREFLEAGAACLTAQSISSQ